MRERRSIPVVLEGKFESSLHVLERRFGPQEEVYDANLTLSWGHQIFMVQIAGYHSNVAVLYSLAGHCLPGRMTAAQA
jgi:hypothetical protein